MGPSAIIDRRRLFLSTGGSLRVIFIAISWLFPVTIGAQQTEADRAVMWRAGEEAEAAGNLREALRQYALYHRTIDAAADTNAMLHGKIFRIATALRPPPALPDSALNYEFRGEAAFNTAKTPEDFSFAAAEYRKAHLAAPWVSRFVYNMGLLAEKAGDIGGASAAFRSYLLAPDATDAMDVRRKLAAIELQLERLAIARAADEARVRASGWSGAVLNFGNVAAGSLDANDLTDNLGWPYDVWAFAGVSAQRIRVRVASPLFEPFLLLRDFEAHSKTMLIKKTGADTGRHQYWDVFIDGLTGLYFPERTRASVVEKITDFEFVLSRTGTYIVKLRAKGTGSYLGPYSINVEVIP